MALALAGDIAPKHIRIVAVSWFLDAIAFAGILVEDLELRNAL